MLYKLWLDFYQYPWQKKYVLPLMLINLGGSVYGYYWYRIQLASTSVSLWLFVPDSPFSTTLFSLVLAASFLGLRNTFLETLAFTSCIKYGTWAVVVISHFWSAGGEIAPLGVMLWVSHWGMVFEGWIYLRTLALKQPAILGTGTWMAVNDFVDYRLGLHPYLFQPEQFSLAGITAGSLTILLFLVLVSRSRQTESGK